MDLDNVISEIGALAYKKEIVLEEIEKLHKGNSKVTSLSPTIQGLRTD
jgi:hypothetical protein